MLKVICSYYNILNKMCKIFMFCLCLNVELLHSKVDACEFVLFYFRKVSLM